MVDLKFRDANGMVIVVFDFDWWREFYSIIWDLTIERKTGTSKFGLLGLPKRFYGHREINKLKFKIKGWDKWNYDYLSSAIVWRSCNFANFERDNLTRRYSNGEIVNHWEGWQVGGDGNNSNAFIGKKPKLPSLDEFIQDTSTTVFLMGKYILWDNLRANADVIRLKELKRCRGVSDDDTEVRTFEAMRRVANREYRNWVRDYYKIVEEDMFGFHTGEFCEPDDIAAKRT
jgi:hypothetical protein